MGACECENPMEFGYELNSSDKETSISKKILSSNNNNNYYKEEIINIEKNIPKENFIQNEEIEIQKEEEGINALKTYIEEQNKKNIDNINDASKLYFTTTTERPRDNFSEYLFDNINKIRENPQSFIEVIEKSKSNIFLDKRGFYIYKSNVKVALNKGKDAFDEAINYLKNLKPMKPLIFSNELMIQSPNNEEQVKDKKYMNEQINLKVQNGIPIKSFWRDIIKDSKTCLLLMIVDDTGINSGKKRNDILDPSMQCIGIVSKKIGNSFASYVTLC